MDFEQAMKMTFTIVGGLGIFLLGMKNMSEGMQAVAGDKLRKLIGAVTNNRIMACIVGTIVTCIIQSSSVTTVMVVGMVNATLMNLTQAIGVILGANIGTTITGWVLVLKIGKYGLPMLGIATFFFLFSKRDRIRFTASFFLGLGMVFFGLELMKNGFKPLKDLPQFVEMFYRFSPTSYFDYFDIIKCVLVGAALTMIVQSSSATLGITIGLATTGVITFPAAAALVLGENIGTTITAYLASLGASRNAKRASYAHIMINIIGVIWIVSIFGLYIPAVVKFVGLDKVANTYASQEVDSEKFGFTVWTEPVKAEMAAEDYKIAKDEYDHAAKTMTAAIAATHTGFNVVNMLVFLPFVGLLAKLLYKIVPEGTHVEKPHLTFLDVRMLDAPAIGIEQSKKEIVKMSDRVEEMMVTLRDLVYKQEPNEVKEEEIFRNEKELDVIQKEVSEFLGHIMAGNVSLNITEEGRSQLRMADEYESISDYITNILKFNLKMRETGQQMSDEGLKDILNLHDHVADYTKLIREGVRTSDKDIITQAQVQGKSITMLMKEYRTKHLNRLSDGTTTALKSLIFTDILNAYRRIKDHAFNIAEVLAGEK